MSKVVEFMATNEGMEAGYHKFVSDHGEVFHVRPQDCAVKHEGERARIVYTSFGNRGAWYVAKKP